MTYIITDRLPIQFRLKLNLHWIWISSEYDLQFFTGQTRKGNFRFPRKRRKADILKEPFLSVISPNECHIGDLDEKKEESSTWASEMLPHLRAYHSTVTLKFSYLSSVHLDQRSTLDLSLYATLLERPNATCTRPRGPWTWKGMTSLIVICWIFSENSSVERQIYTYHAWLAEKVFRDDLTLEVAA